MGFPLKPVSVSPMAEQIALWVRDDVEPLAMKLGAPLRVLDNFDSYECRGRNRIPGAKLSEHGAGEAFVLGGALGLGGVAYQCHSLHGVVLFDGRHDARLFNDKDDGAGAKGAAEISFPKTASFWIRRTSPLERAW